MRKVFALLLCLLSLSLAVLPVDATGATEPLSAFGASVSQSPVAPDGSPAQIPLPVELHQKNRGGSDGSGLCVFCSMRHSGRWQNDPLFDALFEWMWTHPGGGYPAKVDAMLKQCAAEKGLEVPQYIQVESDDLDILELATKTGRLPGVTYGYSPTGRYGGRYVAHMVSLAHAKGDTWAVIDNNFPGTWEWMTRSQFLRAYKGRDTKGWAVILLNSPPPPVPLIPPPAPR